MSQAKNYADEVLNPPAHEDLKMCNCARCEVDLIAPSHEIYRSHFGLRKAFLVNGRPYCSSCKGAGHNDMAVERAKLVAFRHRKLTGQKIKIESDTVHDEHLLEIKSRKVRGVTHSGRLVNNKPILENE